MSLITDDDPGKSPRHCSWKHRRRRRALIAASSTLASLLSLAIILWLTLLCPSSPSFSLLAATVTTTDNGTVIVVNAAFTARNPNAHAVALYDRLQASASYAGVPLGAGVTLPSLQQQEGDVVMSAALRSPWTAGMTDGPALLWTRIQGQLRWKVAAWVSGRHGLAVDCVGVVQGPLRPQCATQVLS